MNVRISTDFKFTISSISYAPNGELLITLSSPESRGGSRYEYAADLGSGSAVEKPSVSLAGYSRGYVEKSRIKEKSKDPYRQLVKYLERYGDTTVDRVTTEYLQDFIAFMQASGLSDGTVRLYFQKLACVLHNAYREGLFDDRVLQRVQRVRRPREKKCFLSEQELRKMVRARRHGRREKTESMFLFSCLTGLRFGDVTSLKWRDVKRDGRRMRLEFTQHKTGTQESLPLCECAEALLRGLDRSGEYVFGAVNNQHANNMLKRWCAAAGVRKPVTFHTARHTFCVLLLTSGVPIFTVQQLMCHSDIGTTEVYADLLNRTKTKAVGRLPLFDVGRRAV